MQWRPCRLQDGGWRPACRRWKAEFWTNYASLWWKSPTGTPLQLAWRLGSVAPELARSRETAPGCRPVELQGTSTSVVETEELLLDALTRERDYLVSWQCDAAVLLRNRQVDWPRLKALLRNYPAAAGRLEQLHRVGGAAVPPHILKSRQPGRMARRLSRIRADYRWLCWDAEREESPAGFVLYLWKRLLRRAKAGTT